VNIAKTTVNHGSFKTLVTAVKAADLFDTLISEGPFTVFAPMDLGNTRKIGEQGTIDLYFDLPCSCGQNYVDRSIR
jgi:hypothetical protein